VSAEILRELKPLEGLRAAGRDGALKGLARGLAHRLVESLGSIERRGHEDLISALSAQERRAMRVLGVRIGAHSVYLPALLKPRSARLLALLHAAGPRGDGRRAFLPQPGRVTLPAAEARTASSYGAAGYRRCGPLAVRLDMLERLADALRVARAAAEPAPFTTTPEMLALLGCGHSELAQVLQALGYRRAPAAKDAPADAAPSLPAFWLSPRRPKRRAPPELRRSEAPAASSPFAALADLKPATEPTRRHRPRRRGVPRSRPP
jgi:ATP-dependent RNA helicase SUPV3L1/SUV3